MIGGTEVPLPKKILVVAGLKSRFQKRGCFYCSEISLGREASASFLL